MGHVRKGASWLIWDGDEWVHFCQAKVLVDGCEEVG
jgi:hypothetical protein